MNTIKNIQALNKRELEDVVAPSASWHTDYRDTAYVFIGGLSFDLTEGDLETIFSQYGVPTWIKLQRDKETGKSKGFAFLKYEDQRSCDLAVDNLGGATVLGRIMRVDHTRYKKREGEEEEDEQHNIKFEEPLKPANGRHSANPNESSKARHLSKTKAEKELEELIRNHDDDDPMKEYLISEKREEIAAELKALDDDKPQSNRHHRHHHDKHRDHDRDHGRDRRDRERRKHRHRSRSGERRRRSISPERPRGDLRDK